MTPVIILTCPLCTYPVSGESIWDGPDCTYCMWCEGLLRAARDEDGEWFLLPVKRQEEKGKDEEVLPYWWNLVM